MRAIRSKHTKLEVRLHELLSAMGIEFEEHANDLPGTPDVVLRDRRLAVFANGCFWHGHDCHLFRMPAERRDFWQPKIEKNRERDLRKRMALIEEGWRVLIVWECATKGRLRQPQETLIEGIGSWVHSGDAPGNNFAEIRCLPEKAQE